MSEFPIKERLEAEVVRLRRQLESCSHALSGYGTSTGCARTMSRGYPSDAVEAEVSLDILESLLRFDGSYLVDQAHIAVERLTSELVDPRAAVWMPTSNSPWENATNLARAQAMARMRELIIQSLSLSVVG